MLADAVREREALAIPADAVGEKAGVAIPLGWPVDGAFDAPVVRHVDPAPGCIVKAGLFGRCHIPKMETPTGVEGDDFARAGRRVLGRGESGGRQPKRGAKQNEPEVSNHRTFTFR